MRTNIENAATQIHLVAPTAARRTPAPEKLRRIPVGVITTVDLTHGPGREASTAPVARADSATPEAQARPAAETRKGKQPRARKNEPVPPEKPDTIKAKPRTGKKAAGKSERKSKPTAREGSKKDTVLALLRRPEGATLAQIVKATEWQAHSVRGFLSGTVGKKMKLKLKSGKRDNGERVYSVRA